MSAYEPTTEDSTEPQNTIVVEAGPRWKGPFAEYDKYGNPTGVQYVRCSRCGAEVVEGHTEHATHRDGCDGVE